MTTIKGAIQEALAACCARDGGAFGTTALMLDLLRIPVFLRLPVAFFFALGFGVTRSGSFSEPVSRFHSSYVSSEILPWSRSSANFRRWALLLNGMSSSIGGPFQ